jgi:TonB family protein
MCAIGLAMSAGVQAQLPLAKVTTLPTVEFPVDALTMKLGGTVRVTVLVDSKGKPEVVDATGPLAPCTDLDDKRATKLREAAIKAAKKSFFEPAMQDGKPVDGGILLKFDVPMPPVPESEKGVPKLVQGGVINGRARALPAPSYPDEAKKKHTHGTVEISILIDEDGNVLGATTQSGPSLLREVSTEAACKAKFSPTTIQGHPVKVSAVITYNFAP